ncbi:MAG: hypothetical protein J6U56_05435 [Spirochaetia bacterium]|nr:hypothetical protein [Spirochaetia bacterium]
MNRLVHHNKCSGGHAFDEVDGKTYCLGQTDASYENEVFVPECKKCPRLLKNNEVAINEFCAEAQKKNGISREKRKNANR